MESRGQEVVKAYKRLVSKRTPLDTHWREAYEYSNPLRGQGFYSNVDGFSGASTAKAQQSKIFDSTGTDSTRLLASSLIGGLTPKASQWFALSIPNVPDAHIPRSVRQWLQSSSETLFSMIHSSNYDAQAFEFFIDVVIAGMAGLYIERNESTGNLHFEAWPLHSLYVADSTKAEKIDTVFRRVCFTAGEAAAKFGFDKLTDDQKRTLEEDPSSNTQHHYIHVIQPRFRHGKRASGRTKNNLPFESIYVCEKTGTIAYESGYHEFPVIIPRWAVVPGTEYAVGPLNDALPDVKTLNSLIEMMMHNAEMAIAGTFVAKDDGVINPNTVRIGPRRIIFASDTDNIKPLASGGNFRVAEGEIMRLQSQIKRVMMSDELAPSQQNRTMTAEEVRTRTQLIRQILGPTYGRLQAEFLNPLIDRVFGLAFRAGDLGQPPDELLAFKFVPEYKSPLARAQRFDDVTAMDRFEASLAQSSQVLGPEVLDLYDADLAVQKRAEMLGIPVELMREQREVEQIRRQRAEAQAQAQQMELLQQQGQLTQGQSNQLVSKVL